MKKKVAIVDYGLGNILSAQQSFKKVIHENELNIEVIITNQTKDIDSASHIVLPGQGAFASCMHGLKSITGMVNVLKENVINCKKPFLGICVGMQLLADISYENGEHCGLGWIKGSIEKLKVNNLKLPHMGWNNVKIINNSFKMKFPNENKDFYFVHSYFFNCKESVNIIGSSHYGSTFASIVGQENIYGVQFHPEKSSEQGLQLIKDFVLL
tara:strand:+ start:31 stop:666 length:636 start_codon:yes stop_codon:yes gene_type:complete